MNTKKVSEVFVNDVIILDTGFYGVSKDEECKVLKVNEGVSLFNDKKQVRTFLVETKSGNVFETFGMNLTDCLSLL